MSQRHTQVALILLASSLGFALVSAVKSSSAISFASEPANISMTTDLTARRAGQDDKQSPAEQQPVDQADKSHRNPAGSKQRAQPSRATKARERPGARPAQSSDGSDLARPTRSPQLLKSTATRQDPFWVAQQQAKLMFGYNNTPPLFITATRDFFVDVSRFPLGTKITTIHASDMDGDPLEYSLQPALLHDASPYFAINATSGELRLADRQFPYYDSLKTSDIEATSQSDALAADSEDAPDSAESRDEDSEELGNRNLYFLNVLAADGHYTSALELQIHVINSSALAMNGGLPVQLTPESSARAREQTLQRKQKEFYDRLHKLPESQQSANTSSPVIVYPNFVNPALARPETIADTPAPMGSPVSEEPRVTSTVSPSAALIASNNERQELFAHRHMETQRTANTMPKGLPSAVGLPNDPQPMIATLVVACSCLMLALVLLMFIVPISVKRLRRRLKHVEMQHERMSHHGSSTVCSSSASSSSMTTHNHAPSLSQFTLGSDGSCRLDRGVCRQSSLDSNVTVPPPPRMLNGALNRVNNGSIANPIYLEQPKLQDARRPIDFSQPHLQHNPTFIAQTNLVQNYLPEKPCENIYYPLDDEFYSTINIDPTAFSVDPQSSASIGLCENDRSLQADDQHAQDYHMALYQPPAESPEPKRALESRNSDSSSSIRSLARFLSLPARHSSHQQYQQSRAADDLDGLAIPPGAATRLNDQSSKTIARTNHVSRERPGHKWELERRDLKFLEILDEGQFGLVWRCKLRLAGGKEQTVAVKTLKNSAARDNRGREELLAEIEIMKRVCRHPNVVEILHCCTADTASASASTSVGGGKPILLVMEYAELGKLQSFLEKSRINHNYATNLFNGHQATGDQLTSRDLVKFIYHIAKGMEYVSSQCIVHRDLASRNILVSSQRICKVGDFGMARHTQSLSGVYERHSRNAKVPVRWMAPEVLLNNRFTTKSDVFSFGILMWEIVTLGSTPYRHLKAEQVVEAVARRGDRPEKPVYCHPQLYQIMSRCWQTNPDQRPTFGRLVEQLGEMFLSPYDYIELDQYPDHDYYNISKIAAPDELL